MTTSEKEEVTSENGENLVRSRVMQLWKPGNLFFNTSRYSRKKGYEHIDRLAEILRKGLIPPALDMEGTVVSDLNITVIGAKYNYSEVVFLHLFGDNSYLYIPFQDDKLCFFVDPETKFITNGADIRWPLLCIDEVYVPRIIEPKELIGIAVAPNTLKDVYNQFHQDFKRLSLPLYDFSGKVFWPN